MELFLSEVCHSALERGAGPRPHLRRGDRGGGRPPPRRARADRGLPSPLGGDAGGPDRGDGRGPRGAQGRRPRASCAHQLVRGEIPDRARALRLPDLVREHPGVGRARPDQARSEDLRAAARAHRAPGRRTASTSTTTRRTSRPRRRWASMRCASTARSSCAGISRNEERCPGRRDLRRSLRWLALGLTGLLVLVALGLGGGYLWLRQSLPQIDGEIAVAGLDGAGQRRARRVGDPAHRGREPARCDLRPRLRPRPGPLLADGVPAPARRRAARRDPRARGAVDRPLHAHARASTASPRRASRT